jgi:hypothetical protein
MERLSAHQTRARLGRALVLSGLATACSPERYARPSGPAPVYESLPLPAWDAGPPASGEGLDLDAVLDGSGGDAGARDRTPQGAGPGEETR